MNPLWPASTRASCLNPRTLFQSCHKIDSLAARLAQRSLRQYTNSSSPFRRKDTPALNSALGPLASSRVLLFANAACRLPAGIRSYASQRIITHYNDLPTGYKDEEGLLFRTRPVTREEAIKIFGKVIDVNTANRLLRVVHGRRVAGTLEDPECRSHAFEKRSIKAGLSWLRKNVPVDEIECAGLRAEKELAEMELDIIEDSERIGLYKPISGYTPNSGQSKNVYGDGVFDKVRKANEAKFAAEEKKRNTQADEITQNTGTLQTTRPESRVELRRPGENPRLKYYLERSVVWPDKPPEMTAWARLWPSGLFAVLFISGCILFASLYTPPRKENRLWPDMPPAAATVITLILLNTIVFAAWRIPPAFRILNKYFISVPGYPRALSMLGNIFSHQSLGHLGFNMFFLYFVGTNLHDREEIGRGNFLAIYLSTGVLASFVSLSSWVLRNNFVSSSLGASGAIMGIIATFCLLKGEEKVRFFGVFPPENWPSISCIAFLVVLVGLDVLGIRRGSLVSLVDSWAHLGGYTGGAVAAGVVRWRMYERENRRGEEGVNDGEVKETEVKEEKV